MYARTVKFQEQEQVHTFGVSGKLVMNVLVMYDRQTQSYWSQILGEAIEGPLLGAKLTPLAALQTTWAEWKRLHPATHALATNGMGLYDSYSSYYASNQAGVLGETRQDDRLPRKALVTGIVIDEEPVVYPHSVLAAERVVNDQVGTTPLVVVYEPTSATATVFQRMVDGQRLTFRPGVEAMTLIDNETGSTWPLLTGRATIGPLAGKSLTRVPSTSSFWFGWKDWHPQTRIYGQS